MYRRFTNYTITLGIACMLSACGFQLRGTSDNGTTVPEEWKSMHLVTGNPNGEFTREVQSRFAANGVQWVEKERANFILTISPERFSQRNLSLNSEARAAEFELTMSAEFTVRDANDDEVMPSTDVAVVKQMENDPRNVVGKAEEVRLLKGEMRSELAQQIMRRIGFFASSTR
ncbi:MAG: LPS assembly lipoprotein LptE [Halioglobus sp.]